MNNIIQSRWNNFIEKECQNYKKFNNCNVIPSYEINYVDENEITIDYIMQTDTSCNPMILNVNTTYMTDEKYLHCQPTLFHEFTHMWDSENLFKNKSDRHIFLSFYTEYHASQIEFLRFIECRSINDINYVSAMDEFYIFDKKMSVVDYYLNVCRSLFKKSCKYKSDKTPLNYKLLMDAYMYVFGIKSMYKK